MFACGEFRDDAAILRVHLDLRRNHGGANHAITHDGGTGFITGSFKREQQHARRVGGNESESIPILATGSSAKKSSCPLNLFCV